MIILQFSFREGVAVDSTHWLRPSPEGTGQASGSDLSAIRQFGQALTMEELRALAQAPPPHK
jgi:hypothetical protein